MKFSIYRHRSQMDQKTNMLIAAPNISAAVKPTTMRLISVIVPVVFEEAAPQTHAEPTWLNGSVRQVTTEIRLRSPGESAVRQAVGSELTRKVRDREGALASRCPAARRVRYSHDR
jgi:hypothetical protein